MPVEPLFPTGDQLLSYPGSINVDLSHPGRVAPAFDHAALSGSLNPLHYFGSAFIETIDEFNLPVVFAWANKTVYKIQNGVISVDNTFTGGVIQGLAMVEGVPDRAFLSVTGRVLMAVFGAGDPVSGGSGGNATRNMGTGVWTNNTNSATFLTAYGLAVASDQIGAATGTLSQGRVAGTAAAPVPERKFAVCVVGSDPVLITSWSTAQAVDIDPTWQINGIAVYEDRFCIGMPQGFYVRDQQEGRFKNMTHNVRAHGTNGKLCVAAENGVWYGTRHELYFFDGRRMNDYTPFRGMEKPRDMPQGRVTAMFDDGARGLAVLECWSDVLEGPHAAGAGLRVFKEDGGTVTELTSSALDGSMGTTANMEDWGNTTTDYLVFAFPRPLAVLGIRTLLASTANTADQSFTAPQALNGSGTWTSLGNIRDASILSTTARSMQLTGFPASSGESIIGWDAINAFDIAGKEAAAPAGYSGTNLYWYRVRNASAAGFNATGAVAGFQEAFVVPARPGLANSGLLGATTNFTSLFRGGGVTRILEFVREGSRITWQDKYHIVTGGGVTSIGLTQSPTGPATTGGSNSGPAVIVLGRFGQFFIMEGRTRDASQQKNARLVQVTTTEPAPILSVYNAQFGDRRRLTKLNKVSASGVYVQPTDKIQLQIQLDEWKVYDLGVRSGSNAEWPIDEKQIGQFARCHFFFILSDAAQYDPAAPYWQNFLVEYEDAGALYQQAAFPTGAEAV